MESLQGAAALLHKVEVDAGVAADELLLSALRPVDTATAPLAPPSSPRSPVRSLRKAGRQHAGRDGFGRRQARAAGQPDRRRDRRSGNSFRRLGDRLRSGGAADLRGGRARLARRRRDRRAGRRRADPQPDPDRRAGRRRGRPRRPRTRRVGRGGGRRRRPRLPCDGRPDRAVLRAGTRSRRRFSTSASSPANWRIPRRSPSPAGPDRPIRLPSTTTTSTAPSTAGVVRYTPAQAHSVLRLAPPGNVVAVRLRVDSDRRAGNRGRRRLLHRPRRRSTTGRGCGAVSPTRAAPSSRCWPPTSSPTRRRRCRTSPDGRTHRSPPSPRRPRSARGTTPGLPPDTVVCDIGGGTIDLIGCGSRRDGGRCGRGDHHRRGAGARHPARARRAGQADTCAAGRGSARRARGGRPAAVPGQPGAGRRDRPAVHARKCRSGAVLQQAGGRGVAQSAPGDQTGDGRGQHRPRHAGLRRTAHRTGTGRGRGARRRTAPHGRRIAALDPGCGGTGQHRRRARPAVRGGVRARSPLRAQGLPSHANLGARA